MIYAWQNVSWQLFLKAVDNTRLPHAFLISGIKGIGKRSFAETAAQRLMCSSPLHDGLPCGACHACTLFLTKAHPDALWLEPEKDKSTIKIDQVRSLTNFVNQSALQGAYRTVIIHPADELNINAANALLKTLEEPSSGTVIFLITDQPGQLPPTILSRCQQIRLSAPSEAEGLSWLTQQAKKKYQDNELKLALHLASNAPLQAFKLLKEGGFTDRKTVVEALIAIKQRSMKAIDAANQLQDIDILFFIDVALSFARDWLCMKLGYDRIVNQDMLDALSTLTEQGVAQPVVKWMDKLQWVRGKLCVGVHLNKQLVMEDLLIRWARS